MISVYLRLIKTVKLKSEINFSYTFESFPNFASTSLAMKTA